MNPSLLMGEIPSIRSFIHISMFIKLLLCSTNALIQRHISNIVWNYTVYRLSVLPPALPGLGHPVPHIYIHVVFCLFRLLLMTLVKSLSDSLARVNANSPFDLRICQSIASQCTLSWRLCRQTAVIRPWGVWDLWPETVKVLDTLCPRRWTRPTMCAWWSWFLIRTQCRPWWRRATPSWLRWARHLFDSARRLMALPWTACSTPSSQSPGGWSRWVWSDGSN